MHQQQQQQQREQEENYTDVYHKELLRCVGSVYSYVEESHADYKNSFISYVSERSTGVIEGLFRQHSRGTCSCGLVCMLRRVLIVGLTGLDT